MVEVVGELLIIVTDEEGFRQDPDTLVEIATALSKFIDVGVDNINIHFGFRRLQQLRSDARRLAGAGAVDVAYDIEVHAKAAETAPVRAEEVVEEIKHMNLDQLAGEIGTSKEYYVEEVTEKSEPRIKSPGDGRLDASDSTASGSLLLLLALGALVVGGSLAWFALRRSRSQREFRRAVEGPMLKVRVPENLPLLNIGEEADVPVQPSGEELITPRIRSSRKLSEAALQGKTARAKVLLMEGAEADFQDRENEKMTPLMNAALGGSLDVCRVLLDANAEVNLRSEPGGTPLMMACQGGHKQVVEHLLAKKAQVSLKTDNRETAMFFAADYGSTEIAQLLLDHGAVVKGVRSAGNLCLHRANEKRHQDMVELLKKAGADPIGCQCPACVEFPSTPTHRSPRFSPEQAKSPRLNPEKEKSPRLNPEKAKSPRVNPEKAKSPRFDPETAKSPRLKPEKAKSPIQEKSPRSLSTGE